MPSDDFLCSGMWTITAISDMLDADSAGHRALRTAAQLGTLDFDDPLGRAAVDGRGTQAFRHERALFRAAWLLALTNVGIGVTGADEAIRASEAAADLHHDALSLDEAVDLARRGVRIHWREIVPGSAAEPVSHPSFAWWGHRLALADWPIHPAAAAVRLVDLTNAWAPIIFRAPEIPVTMLMRQLQATAADK